jgi:hypothetical protein
VALVFGDAGPAGHLRDAVSTHVQIVYETSASDFDASQLSASQATAALVNLDGCDWLEAIEARLDEAGVTVVFNDPEISGSLEGWEQARWLRHLTAKLSGHGNYDPPRPLVEVTTPAANDESESEPESGLARERVVDALAVAERPLSPTEIASMTADFGAAQDQTMTPGLDEVPNGETLPPDAADNGSKEEVAMNASTEAEWKGLVSERAGNDTSDPASPKSNASPADFEDPGTLDVDTEALSAMIDARLANAEDHASPESPVWRVVEDNADVGADSLQNEPGHADSTAAENVSTAARVSASPVDESDVLKGLPALEDWQLLDPESAVAAASPKQEEAPASVLLDSLNGLELMPIETVPVIAQRQEESIERWMHDVNDRDGVANNKKPGPKGNEA